ncbi:16 kDa phloem protein 2-like isoform X1 [Argentina anserina]|uniref:16 kDa phloem protein 2-like isoform X1 n=1 Tax=Argentina anserina TaxID=57926 RepID=UPI0021766A06|nr:16 kDa phloem protein 2-like isoform X1 [Potentilla anserina]
MPHGTLEVLLVKAKDLEDDDFLGKMDPYVILTLRTQEKKSSVVQGQGSEPEWNETFQFTVSSDDVTELSIKIMDKDTFSSDDFVGEATIPLETVFMQGSIEPTKYNVVNENKEYHGEITVGLTFTQSSRHGEEESYGGYKESSYRD